MSSGKKVIRSVEKEPVHNIEGQKGWYSWIFNPLFGHMKTRSTSSGKREAEFSIHSSGTRNDMLYTRRLAEEPGFSILSSGKKKMLSSWHVKNQGAGSSICSSEIKKLQRVEYKKD